MQILQKVTIEYSDAEDRIRLTGDSEQAVPVVIWLTQRLLQRILQVLVKKHEPKDKSHPHHDVFQSFAQQAARSELEQTPVESVQPRGDSPVWLVTSVEITHSEQEVSLVFRGDEGQHAKLVLGEKHLRQWLGILHGLYLKAEWPLDVWPEWIGESRSLVASQQAARLH